MASRWRRWDCDYAIDILDDSGFASENFTPSTLPMGRGEVKISLSKISIPKPEPKIVLGVGASTINNGQKSRPGLGRGRGWRGSKAALLRPQGIQRRNLTSTERENEFNLQATEWVSLRDSIGFTKPSLPSKEIERSSDSKMNYTWLERLIRPCPDGDGVGDTKEDRTLMTAGSGSVSGRHERNQSESNQDKLEEYTRLLGESVVKNGHAETLVNESEWIAVEGIPNTDQCIKELRDVVCTFGDIKQLKTEPNGKLLIRMSDSSQCDWVIGCLDGTKFSSSLNNISVTKIADAMVKP